MQCSVAGATNFFLNGIVLSVLYGGSSLIRDGEKQSLRLDYPFHPTNMQIFRKVDTWRVDGVPRHCSDNPEILKSTFNRVWYRSERLHRWSSCFWGDLASFVFVSWEFQRNSHGPNFQFIHVHPSIRHDDGVCIPYHTLWGEVRFENVKFAYPMRSDHHVFENLNLTIPAGQVVALCGPSGEGAEVKCSVYERISVEMHC